MSSTFFLAITNVLVITLRKTFETKFISANKVVDVFIVFYAFLTKKTSLIHSIMCIMYAIENQCVIV